MKQITDLLENSDPQEKKGFLTLSDDLSDPVSYSDRDEVKDSYILNGGYLPEATIHNTNLSDPGIEQSEQHQRVEDERKLLNK